MWAAIRTSWPLFAGMIFLMVSNGLLALRASAMGFGETVIGLVQSAYPLGSLLGCFIAPMLVVRVGHVRVFAALASIASTAALIHLVTHDPWSWGAMRLLSGLCFSGLYVVAESWLNGRATNENRGSLLSIYFIIQTGGVAAGQTLLNLSTPDGILLFILVSVLISLSLVPILISADASPPFVVPEWISPGELFRLSPMGLTGAFLNGISQGAIYVALVLYGQALGLKAGAVGVLVGCATLGGMLFQFPLGRLSDIVDRRLVITGAAGLAVPVCLLMLPFDSAGRADLPMLYAGITVIGGLTLPLYSICMAHMNDYLKPGQVVAASGTLTLVLGTGMVFGPALGSLAVERYGPAGLFWFLGIIQCLTVTTALFRLWHGQPRSATRGTAVAMGHANTACAAPLNPEAPRLTPQPAAAMTPAWPG